MGNASSRRIHRNRHTRIRDQDLPDRRSAHRNNESAGAAGSAGSSHHRNHRCRRDRGVQPRNSVSALDDFMPPMHGMSQVYNKYIIYFNYIVHNLN